MSTPNKTFVFKKIPQGFPVPGQDLVVEDRPIDLDAVPKGGLVVKNLVASFDPYMRGRMRDASVKSYSPAFALDGPVTSNCVARVLRSDAPGLAAGDLVVAMAAVAEYAHVDGAVVAAGAVRPVRNPHGLDPGLFVGQLGMPGLTAFSSLYEIGRPRRGETIFVSSAAGAVGQVVGQLAKREGLRVVASVGSDEKAAFVTGELGFDAVTNYRREAPADALARLAPDGIDIYYENVGGETLEAALGAMREHGRIVACGMISQYNSRPEELHGVKNLMLMVSRKLTMRGFIVSDKEFGPAYYQEHQDKMQQWLAEGSFKATLHYTEGIDKAAEGFVGMLRGENFGKAVLRIADA